MTYLDFSLMKGSRYGNMLKSTMTRVIKNKA